MNDAEFRRRAHAMLLSISERASSRRGFDHVERYEVDLETVEWAEMRALVLDGNADTRPIDALRECAVAEPPSSGPETSAAAARRKRASATECREQVREVIRAAGPGGITDEGICQRLCWSGNSVRPRRWELVRLGLVRDTGRTERAASGCRAILWASVE